MAMSNNTISRAGLVYTASDCTSIYLDGLREQLRIRWIQFSPEFVRPIEAEPPANKHFSALENFFAAMPQYRKPPLGHLAIPERLRR